MVRKRNFLQRNAREMNLVSAQYLTEKVAGEFVGTSQWTFPFFQKGHLKI
jgi:hypothetical protein